jgi:hypothetical protein
MQVLKTLDHVGIVLALGGSKIWSDLCYVNKLAKASGHTSLVSSLKDYTFPLQTFIFSCPKLSPVAGNTPVRYSGSK